MKVLLEKKYNTQQQRETNEHCGTPQYYAYSFDTTNMVH